MLKYEHTPSRVTYVSCYVPTHAEGSFRRNITQEVNNGNQNIPCWNTVNTIGNHYFFLLFIHPYDHGNLSLALLTFHLKQIKGCINQWTSPTFNNKHVLVFGSIVIATLVDTILVYDLYIKSSLPHLKMTLNMCTCSYQDQYAICFE